MAVARAALAAVLLPAASGSFALLDPTDYEPHLAGLPEVGAASPAQQRTRSPSSSCPSSTCPPRRRATCASPGMLHSLIVRFEHITAESCIQNYRRIPFPCNFVYDRFLRSRKMKLY